MGGPATQQTALELASRIEQALAGGDRPKWIRAFNRLEMGITRHNAAKAGTGFEDDADEELYRVWRSTLKDVGVRPAGEGELRDAEPALRVIENALRLLDDGHVTLARDELRKVVGDDG